MGWFVRERRGAVSWTDQTLGSISAPPFPLLAFFALFMTLTLLATYSEFQRKMENGKKKIKLCLLMLPVLGILAVYVMLIPGRWWGGAVAARRRPAVGSDGGGDLPWGLMLFLGIVVVMGYYQSSFQSALFRI